MYIRRKVFSQVENWDNGYEMEERLYSTGDYELDVLLERAFCEGYEAAQREFAAMDKAGNVVMTMDEIKKMKKDGISMDEIKKIREKRIADANSKLSNMSKGQIEKMGRENARKYGEGPNRSLGTKAKYAWQNMSKGKKAAVIAAGTAALGAAGYGAYKSMDKE